MKYYSIFNYFTLLYFIIHNINNINNKDTHFGEIELCTTEALTYNIKVKSKVCDFFYIIRDDFLKISITYKLIIEEFLSKSLLAHIEMLDDKKEIEKKIDFKQRKIHEFRDTLDYDKSKSFFNENNYLYNHENDHTDNLNIVKNNNNTNIECSNFNINSNKKSKRNSIEKSRRNSQHFGNYAKEYAFKEDSQYEYSDWSKNRSKSLHFSKSLKKINTDNNRRNSHYNNKDVNILPNEFDKLSKKRKNTDFISNNNDISSNKFINNSSSLLENLQHLDNNNNNNNINYNNINNTNSNNISSIYNNQNKTNYSLSPKKIKMNNTSNYIEEESCKSINKSARSRNKNVMRSKSFKKVSTNYLINIETTDSKNTNDLSYMNQTPVNINRNRLNSVSPNRFKNTKIKSSIFDEYNKISSNPYFNNKKLSVDVTTRHHRNLSQDSYNNNNNNISNTPHSTTNNNNNNNNTMMIMKINEIIDKVNSNKSKFKNIKDKVISIVNEIKSLDFDSIEKRSKLLLQLQKLFVNMRT